MSLEECPFCGKPFKRLKSHLPHCRMSPESNISKATNKPKERSTTFKQTGNKDKTSQVNTKNTDGLKSNKDEKTRVDELLQNPVFTSPTTVSNILKTEEMYMDNSKAKTKWLAKREKEIFKQDKLLTQAKIKFNSVPRQEKSYNETFTTSVKNTHILEKETVGGQKQASQMSTHKNNCSAPKPLQKIPLSKDWQDNQLIPVSKVNSNVSENIPTLLRKEYALGPADKEQRVPVFQSKTCVWTHIQYRLNGRGNDSVPVLFPIVSAHKSTFTEFVNSSECGINPHTGNGRNATVKVSHKQFPMLQSSVQKPVLGSQFQNLSVLPYSPDMVTGYRGTFCISSHSKVSCENALLKCQTSKPSSPSQGLVTELRLGDVRLNDLVSWLVARMPKSPSKAVSLLNKGWQWYYRKYIDVQKGGIGGIAMLIGSYCVVSYVWRYPHIQKDRWRKYH